MTNSRALLIDLDGTLVDTLPDLAEVTNELLAALGAPPLALEEVRAMVGDGVTKLVARTLAARGIDPGPEPVLAQFLLRYEARPARLSRPYPGVPETLEELAREGWHFALVTNKPLKVSRLLLAALDLERFFGAVIAGDSLSVRKPDPGPVLAALRAIGVSTARAASLGDHANDLRAAAGAGIPAIFARYGYGVLTEELPAPAAAIDAFSELPRTLARLLPP